MQRLDCDALITAGDFALSPKPGGALLQLQNSPAEWCGAAEPWLKQHVKYSQQSLGIAFTGEPTEHESALLDLVADHYARAQVQQSTVSHRATQWGKNFCRTLNREPRWATSLHEPLKGYPAFIVAAGPSLDRNGMLLAEAQKRGPIFAMNSSGPACLHYGVTPDLVLCSEIDPVPDKLKLMASVGCQIAIEAVASEENWAAAPYAWAYGWAEPCLIPYMLQLGALPLNYTGSVACAAVALALLWGADPVVLIGQDCAYTDGRMYASGTPYAGIRCEVKDGLVSFTGDEFNRAPLSTIERVAWGGEGTVSTTHDMAVFCDWFETAANAHTIVNATEGGSRLNYTYELPLQRVLDDLPKRDRVQLPTPERAYTADVREQIKAHARMDMTQHFTPPANFPLLHMWAVGAVLSSAGMTPVQKRDHMQEAMATGCREILEALT